MRLEGNSVRCHNDASIYARARWLSSKYGSRRARGLFAHSGLIYPSFVRCEDNASCGFRNSCESLHIKISGKVIHVTLIPELLIILYIGML